MPVTSYSQNFEDILLWRALSNIEVGFFIDIGAMDPNLDSVSKLFHAKGWKGIHVDANPEFCERLRQERPGDLVIQAAVSNQFGLKDFFVVPGSGISTLVEELALEHRSAGWPVEAPTPVPTITLDGVFDTVTAQDIHWLKIDVEGFERQALEGWSQSPRRPWIVVIEAIAPNRAPTHDTYEALILEKGYRFVYFDGINRYYVWEMKRELESYFSSGPNLWDEIKLSRESPLVDELVQRHDLQMAQLNAELSALADRLAGAQHEADQARERSEEEAQRLNQQIGVEIEANAALRNKVAEASERSRQLAIDLERAETSIAAAEFQTSQLARELNDIREQFENERTTRFQVEARLADAERALSDSCIDEQRVRTELEASEDRSLVLQAEIRRYSSLVSEVEARSAELIKEWSNSEARYHDMRSQFEGVRAELSHVKSQLASASFQAPALTLDALITTGDRGFVQVAYLTLLGREADTVGTKHYLGQLAAGRDRRAVLTDLLSSAEAREFNAHIPGLARLAKRPWPFRRRFVTKVTAPRSEAPVSQKEMASASEAPAGAISGGSEGEAGNPPVNVTLNDVREMLALPARKFILAAYRQILLRDPDPTGEHHFLERLQAGDERISVLASIRWSEEARLIRPVPRSIALATNWFRWRRIGWLSAVMKRRARARFMPKPIGRVVALLSRIDQLEAQLTGDLDQEELFSRIKRAGERFEERSENVVQLAGETAAESRSDASEKNELALPAERKSAISLIPVSALERIANAEAAIRDLLPENVATTDSNNFAIICSSRMPGNDELHRPSIWYAVGADFSELEVGQDLSPNLAMIAAETPQKAMQAENLGIGIPVISVGQSNLPYARLEREWEEIVGRLRASIRGLQNEAFANERWDAERPLRLGIVTTWNERCGIFTHSSELVTAFSTAEVRVYAARRQNLVAKDSSNVHRFWEASKHRNGLSDIVAHLKRLPVDLLVIQFNYDFYNHEELNQFLIDVAKLNIVVMVILHSSADAADARNWRIRDFRSGLQRCGRVIVHAPEDVERLKRFGIEENVLLMPHGVKVQRSSAGSKVGRKVPVLATFGFAFSNKGLVEFITAIGILRDRDVHVRARMLHSIHSSEASRHALEAMRETVRRLDLSDRIQIVSDFLELEKVEHLIADADLFVNPYQHTGESASGAVRLGLRMGLPTLVTPLSIFDDLGDAVFRARGTSPEDLAQSIQSVVAQIRTKSEEARKVSRALNEWLSVHDFKLQAVRLSQIHSSLKNKSKILEVDY